MIRSHFDSYMVRRNRTDGLGNAEKVSAFPYYETYYRSLSGTNLASVEPV